MEEQRIVTSALDTNAPRFTVEPGFTIAEILGKAKVPAELWDSVVVTSHGNPIHQDNWFDYLPSQDELLAIMVIPQGNAGKQILKLVAVIAIAVVAAPLLAGAMGFAAGTMAFNFAVAGITMVGSMVVNALIPPPGFSFSGGSQDDSTSYFIGASSSTFKPMATIPIVYGTHRITANLATTPRIFTAGSTSVFVGTYDFGLGDCILSDLRLDKTDLGSIASSYDGSADTGLHVNDGQMLIHRNVPSLIDPSAPTKGFKPVGLKLASVPVHYQQTNIILDDVDDGSYATTKPNSTGAMIEISFPSGLVEFNNKGDKEGHSVRFEIEYQKKGASRWDMLPMGARAYGGDDLNVSQGITTGDNPGGLSLSLTMKPWQTSAKIGDRFYVEVRTNQNIYSLQTSDLQFSSSNVRVVTNPTPPNPGMFVSPNGVIVVEPDLGAPQNDVKGLADTLKTDGRVDDVELDAAWLDRLHALLALSERIVWVLGALLALAIVLVVGNTIRLSIASRVDEIRVIKLVGATNAWVRRPFLYTGLWFGLVGGLLSWVLLVVGWLLVSGPVEDLARLYGSEFELQPLGAGAALVLLLGAMLLGWIGSWWSVFRHLHQIEP